MLIKLDEYYYKSLVLCYNRRSKLASTAMSLWTSTPMNHFMCQFSSTKHKTYYMDSHFVYQLLINISIGHILIFLSNPNLFSMMTLLK